MGLFKSIDKYMSRLSVKIFLILIICLVVPMYGMFLFMKAGFEQYIQEQLSDRIIQSVSKSEQGIYSSLQDMANVSSVVVFNEQIRNILKGDTESLYTKTLIFDSVIGDILVNNLITTADMKITLLDPKGNVYSNWSLNYHDYSFLMEQDWVQQSIVQNGYITWSMFSPGYIIDYAGSGTAGDDKYISLARSILSEGVTGQRIGTLLISIEQKQLGTLLNQFSYAPDDKAYICLEDGEILLKNEGMDSISPEHIKAQMNLVKTQERGGMRDTYNGQEYLVSSYAMRSPWTFDGQKLWVLHYTNYQGVLSQMEKFSRQMTLTLALFCGVLVILVGFISSRIVRPIQQLSQQMKVYSIGTDLSPLDMKRKDEIGHLNRAFFRMSNRIQELFSNLNHEHEVREKYQFEALRAQVNPHFLFNTLNMIRWMAVVRRADNIVDSIDALGTMLKFSMSRGSELVTLRDELENIQSYVSIQNYRFGGQCQVNIDLAEELLELRVIKFIMQPVVENAVIHGFTDGKGTITISGEKGPDMLTLWVTDNGRGIEPEKLQRLNVQATAHRDEKKLTGIGLLSINERIQVAYGRQYGIYVQSSPGEGTTVTYSLPIIGQEDEPIEEHYDR